jgi:hypothetical protein
MTEAASMIIQPAARCRWHAMLPSDGDETSPAGEAVV